jgi:LuxR family transcriptional regulator, maltose regulon positive regulatory protein
MPELRDGGFFLRTKLHRPTVTAEHLHRTELFARLHFDHHRPLILVSAPAGYGKSTLISCWLETSAPPNAWLSLDESDNDFRQFLHYFLTAIDQIWPNSCGRTRAMLQGAILPPLALVVDSIISEVDQINHHFVLVLDDYHQISNKKVHFLISRLVQRFCVTLSLVLIGRRDPPLDLTTLRAKGTITEIRIRDLRFSLQETGALLEKLLGDPVETAVAALLQEKTEGWVIGLYLSVLSLKHHDDFRAQLTKLPMEVSRLMDHVIEEILNQKPLAVQQMMVKSSIFNRFCAALCDTVCRPDPSLTDGINGNEFLMMLKTENLFVISLDGEGEWYRYHHLFQVCLHRHLKKLFRPEEIARVNARACFWFADQGLADEAISHALESNNPGFVVNLIKRHRQDIINREQWFQLDRWLRRFPPGYQEHDAELLLSKAWLYQRQGRYRQFFTTLDKIESQLAAADKQPAGQALIRAEFQVLRSFQYLLLGQPVLAETAAREAFGSLPVDSYSARGFALLILAAALQMRGLEEKSRWEVHTRLSEEASQPVFTTMLLAALCFTDWIAADLRSLKLVATQLLKHGEKHSLPETSHLGSFFLGVMHYRQNNLALAARYLEQIVANPMVGELAIPNIINYCQSSFALSSTYWGLGRLEEAIEVADSLISYMLESANSELLAMSQAFRADLALRMGHLAEAELWAQKCTDRLLTPGFRFYAPQCTLPRLLLARNTSASVSEAEELLSQLYRFHAALHNTCVLLEIVALQSLVFAAQGDMAKALHALREMLVLAEPGDVVRPFLDHGAAMAAIVDRLCEDNPALHFARHVRHCFIAEKGEPYHRRTEDKLMARPAPSGLMKIPLTNREIEVLKLLEGGISNNELAKNLYISPETIKRHLSTIYGKLNVKNRLEAVLRAKSIGIL